MSKPNKFEQVILDAAKAAQKFHIEMTEGAYLSYSHESFLQNFIAIEMFNNTGHYVYVDPSPKKIREWLDSPAKKGPKNLRQRFDLVFWFKSGEVRVKAIVEIKATWEKKAVMKDIDKVSKYLKTKDGNNVAGYVLYYTDHIRKPRWNGRDRKFIRDRFCKIEKEKKVELRATHIHDQKDSDPWGVALFRCY